MRFPLMSKQDHSLSVMSHLASVFRLYYRAAECAARIAPVREAVDVPDEGEGQNSPETIKAGTGADEPAQDAKDMVKAASQKFSLEDRQLGVLHWHAAEQLLDATLELARALIIRGSVKDADYYIRQAASVSRALRADLVQARVNTLLAELKTKLGDLIESHRVLQLANEEIAAVASTWNKADGSEGAAGVVESIDAMRVQGEFWAQQEMQGEAGEAFAGAVLHMAGLENTFLAVEALIPS